MVGAALHYSYRACGFSNEFESCSTSRRRRRCRRALAAALAPAALAPAAFQQAAALALATPLAFRYPAAVRHR